MKFTTFYIEVTVDNKHPFIKAFEGTKEEIFEIAFEYTQDFLETELEKYEDAPKEIRFEWFVDGVWNFAEIARRVYIPSDMARGPHYEYNRNPLWILEES